MEKKNTLEQENQEQGTDNMKEVMPPPAESENENAPRTPFATKASGGILSANRFAPKTSSAPRRQSLILVQPVEFDECPQLVDSLKTKTPVIINLDRLDTETGRKVFDFLSGASYAMDATIWKISDNIFLLAPDNIDISDGIQDS
jgi:FtsZ-interacting cell division protein YlmF